MDEMTPKNALARAIELAGGPGMVGKAFEPPISSQAVSQWEIAPPARVKRLVELCGGEVTEHDLRPDIFGPPARQRPEQGMAA